MKKYNFKEIENKWKDKWYTDNIYAAEDFSEKPKKYILSEWPYPSGKMIHIGHAMRYTVPEIYSRYLRMNGYNVLFPTGWDAFGLPTEGFALKQKRTPQEVAEELARNYKKAMQDMGYGIDWDRETNSTDPKYYKWTQWLFLKFFEHGLAKLKEMPVWWCPELGNLADEEILTDKDGNKISERGSHKVKRKLFKQWILKLPEYAERLLSGLETVDYPEPIKVAQRNWIGKSVGAIIKFKIGNELVEVFTTRTDTLFGATFVALAPEHPIVEKLIEKADNAADIKEYVNKAKNMSDREKQALKEKTGIEALGIKATHPLTAKKLPVFITNYILIDYGTGAIMGVPAHDERDMDFAQKYNLEILDVIAPPKTHNKNERPYTGYGTLINSGEFSGLKSEKAIEKILEKLGKNSLGYPKITYKVRDWVFSRQHYWGEPIPVVYKEDGQIEAIVNTEDTARVHKILPLELPYSMEHDPLPDGSAPLARLKDWVETKDSTGRPAKRETQTMPTWAGSSWYYLRFADANNEKEFCNYEKLKYWLPVDHYFGGAEHTTVHLLYSRFWHQFFYDIGIVPTPEPYQKRTNGGLLLAEDGKKMSKRLGNTVEPGELIEKYGADATRMAIAFIGPYTDTYPWNEGCIRATHKLLGTINSMRSKVSENNESNKNVIKAYNILIKKLTEMLENFKMNTGVSEIMKFVNVIKSVDNIGKDIWEGFILALAPFAPFLAEDLWQSFKGYSKWKSENSVHLQSWPKYNKEIVRDLYITIPVQINGKVRDEIEIEQDEDESSVKEKALAREKVSKYVDSKNIKKFMYVEGKIVSFVV
ncbi:leucine--tRNA ligase [Patescibacteria group bacterium]|nr:leucine--tRNA ligase [Patescibacteria group bacterium]